MKNNNFATNNAVSNNNSINGGIAMMNATINSMDVFAATVKEAVEASLGKGYVVNINEVLKNNDTHLTGLTIRTEESNIAPTIYLEGMFERYKAGNAAIPVIVSEIISLYESHKVTMPFDASMITDFSACKAKVCFKLVNADRNKELLSDAPHLIVCDDLAVLFYILVSNDGEGTATITIRTNMSDLWGVDEDELFKIALVNTQRLFRGSVMSMASVMMELLSDRMDEENTKEFYDMVVSDEDMVPMYVCTNTQKINGAGVLLYKDLLKEFAERVGNDFYILPSSIHETLLVPVSKEMQIEYLRSMVREVNATQVAPEEVLSDNVYIYRREDDKISLA